MVWGVTLGKEGWTAGVVTKEGAGGVESAKKRIGGMAYQDDGWLLWRWDLGSLQWGRCLGGCGLVERG